MLNCVIMFIIILSFNMASCPATWEETTSATYWNNSTEIFLGCSENHVFHSEGQKSLWGFRNDPQKISKCCEMTFLLSQTLLCFEFSEKQILMFCELQCMIIQESCKSLCVSSEQLSLTNHDLGHVKNTKRWSCNQSSWHPALSGATVGAHPSTLTYSASALMTARTLRWCTVSLSVSVVDPDSSWSLITNALG